MDDRERVAQQLGRQPQGAFDVVVRDRAGDPLVVRNAPFLGDGTPMPTRYYLTGPDLVRAVSRLEAEGGVRAAEAAIDPAEIAATHRRYAEERDRAIDVAHAGPRPSGGVGGTREGVKCLHAHVAHALAGGDDPVGRWALERIDPAVAASPATALDAAGPQHAVGTVTLDIGDHIVAVTVRGGASFTLPIGPIALLDGVLGRADPPAPMELTNALGLVQDHVDDVLIAAPSIAAAPAVVAVGEHATALARVEAGTDVVAAGYELTREDADEVFRTLAFESASERRHNPGLDVAHVESIVATCCVILGVMRRLDLRSIQVGAPAGSTTGGC